MPRPARRCGATCRRGTLDVVSSDHSGSSYEGERGKRIHGNNAPFPDIPNGVPGLAARLPLVFSEGVAKGRIDLNTYVRLIATNPAKLFGLYPRKGTIAPGSDADLVLWDPGKRVTITNALMQHVIDYTPYEGMEVTGWPVATVKGGRVAMRDGKVQAEPGTGEFLPRAPYAMIKPTGGSARRLRRFAVRVAGHCEEGSGTAICLMEMLRFARSDSAIVAARHRGDLALPCRTTEPASAACTARRSRTCWRRCWRPHLPAEIGTRVDARARALVRAARAAHGPVPMSPISSPNTGSARRKAWRCSASPRRCCAFPTRRPPTR